MRTGPASVQGGPVLSALAVDGRATAPARDVARNVPMTATRDATGRLNGTIGMSGLGTTNEDGRAAAAITGTAGEHQVTYPKGCILVIT